MSDGKKTAETADKQDAAVELSNSIVALEKRVDELERKYALVVEGFEWAANQIRPLFGQGALAVIFDGVAEGLKK